MLYVVSGISRSGTSMAMAALIAGGMPAYVTDAWEYLNDLHGAGDYRPNEDGFFGNDADPAEPTFYHEYDGRLLRVPWQSLAVMPPGDYRVLFMLRDPAEIRASMDRFGLNWGAERALLDVYDKAVPALLASLLFRVSTLRYADVIEDPVGQFKSLGWPIDATAAARVVRSQSV